MIHLHMRSLFGAVIGTLVLALAPQMVSAATLKLSSPVLTARQGDTVTVSVILDTADTHINAAQAILRYPNDVLKGISVDSQSSPFNFWVEEPAIDDTNGTISFIGGTAKGVSGTSLKIFSVVFKVSGQGVAPLTLTDAAVTANDGKGTNVLSSTIGLTFNESGASTKSAPAQIDVPVKLPPTNSATVEPSKVVETPAPIARKAAVATSQAQAPKIRVPSYPDETKWYNQKANVVAFWEIPDDVTQVATKFSQSKDKLPGTIEQQLFNGKDFGIIPKDGVWYVRAQFQNSLGWGPLAYYQISVDTVSPLPFEVELEGADTDNPSPRAKFSTSDSLSGLDQYQLLVDGQLILTTSSSTALLPPVQPGKHELSVRALDKAGNSTEDIVPFTVLPIASPVIDFVTPSAMAGEPLLLSGTAVPNAVVELRFIDKNEKTIVVKTSNSDSEGHWTFGGSAALAMGTYKVVAYAHDARGASSLASEAKHFSVRPQVIISFGVVQLGWFEIFALALLLALSVGALGAWRLSNKRNLQSAYGTIAVRDVKKFRTLMEGHLKNIEKNLADSKSKIDSHHKSEINHTIEQAYDTVSKMEKYLSEIIGKA